MWCGEGRREGRRAAKFSRGANAPWAHGGTAVKHFFSMTV